jgi:hypothetical protein
MAEKLEKQVPSIFNDPRRDHCVGRMLSVGHELAGQGYPHRMIAYAAVEAALDHAKAGDPHDYGNLLRMFEGLARSGLRQIEELAAEHEAAAAP